MPTTTNYGWTTPADTDLVKDGASAIRTLGNSIDSTLKTQIDAQIPDSIIDAKGDLIVGTADNTPARLAYSGVNNDVLMVDTTTASGLKWAAPASGGMTSLASGSLSSTEVSITNINQSYNELVLYVSRPIASSATRLRLRVNNNTTADYNDSYFANGANAFSNQSAQSTILASGGQNINTTETNALLTVSIPFYALTGYKTIQYSFSSSAYGSSMIGLAYYNASTAISSIQIRLDGTATFSAGTYVLYGVK